MTDVRIPQLSEQEMSEGLRRAADSARRRSPKILHAPCDEFNEVVNFILQDSYMQPHLHPAEEKIERIYLIRGRLAVLYFDDFGAVKDVTILENGGIERIEVPAFTWHTYVMLSDSAVTYETMVGEYYPPTWKTFAGWAPLEGSPEASDYLKLLKQQAATRKVGGGPSRSIQTPIVSR